MGRDGDRGRSRLSESFPCRAAVWLGLLAVAPLLQPSPASAARDLEAAAATSSTGVSVTATSLATAQTVLSLPAASYAAETYLLEFATPRVSVAPDTTLRFSLWDDGATIDAIYADEVNGSSGYMRISVFARRRLAVAAGSHTFSVRAHIAAGGVANSTVEAGGGGAGDFAPMNLRAVRANPSILEASDVAPAGEACGSIGNPCQVAGTVGATQEGSWTGGLDAETEERLDLVWYGVWASVGLTLVLMVAPRWFSSFRVTHGA